MVDVALRVAAKRFDLLQSSQSYGAELGSGVFQPAAPRAWWDARVDRFNRKWAARGARRRQRGRAERGGAPRDTNATPPGGC